MKVLILIGVLLALPIIAVILIVCSPFYFGYKIVDSYFAYKTAKNGYRVEDKNPLMSFAMPFIKDFVKQKKS